MKDLLVGLAAAVWFVIGFVFLVALWLSPPPPCPSHYHEEMALGTQICARDPR